MEKEGKGFWKSNNIPEKRNEENSVKRKEGIERMKKAELRPVCLVLTLVMSLLLFPNTVVAAVPSAPEKLKATTVSSSQIKLEWDPVDDATGYYVYMATSLDGSYKKQATVTTTSYKNKTKELAPSTAYYFKIKAYNSSGSSEYSRETSAKTAAPTEEPGTPGDFSAAATGPAEIELTWDAARDATEYYIYRSTSSDSSYTQIAKVKETYYTNSGLIADRTYYYKIRAYNKIGLGNFSRMDSATTFEEASTLDAPSELTATAQGSGKIYLTWDSVLDAASYYVYRSTSYNGTYTKIGTATTESYSDTGLMDKTTYYYKVRAHHSEETSEESSVAYVTTGTAGSISGSTVRLAGQNRYGTSAAVAKSGWSSSYYAVVVSGEDFPDALCSAPLAQTYNAPVLLTSKYKLDDQTKNQLSGLQVKQVFIVGGTGVIASNVELAIKGMGIAVVRIAGNDRYETSVLVARALLSQTDKAVITNGDNFSDALSISSIAAIKGYPILLTARDYTPPALKQYLKDNISSTYVIGGSAAVSNTVYNSLPAPARISGTDRYETNLNILKTFDSDFDFATCYLSTGVNYPDALSGSALAAKNKAPIILTKNSLNQSAKSYLEGKNIEKIVGLGGSGVISDNFLKSLASMVSSSPETPAAPDRVVPSVPANFTVKASSSSEIDLDWDSVSHAVAYDVYRAKSSSGNYSKIGTVTSSSYTDHGLKEDTTYYYKVQARNSYGTSAYSAKDHATTKIVLDAPDDLEATAVDSDEIELTWDEVSGATAYYVYRSVAGGAYTKIATVRTEYYSNTGLSSGKTYSYRVRAYRGGELSSYSSTVSATTD